MTSVQTTSLIG